MSSALDGPVEVAGNAIGGFFGWTVAFIVTVHIGAYVGMCLDDGALLPPGLLFYAIPVFVIFSVIKQDWMLVVSLLIVPAWWLPMYLDSAMKRLVALAVTFVGAAIIAAAF